ncbi:MAG: DUF3592 domain-containing protein [Burkholderiales bacterium]|nr:DUF3592 domain-containing protein [Burkholderiales bacterium]
MKAKLGAALLCLVFAIPFGGIGAGASWVLGRMIYDGQRAEDWVRVKATVDSYDRSRGSVSYRYTFDGVEHRGDRLGANPIGGTDDVDAWHDGIAALMAAAQDGSKPLTVWVNPDSPSESMVDRTIRWKLAAFIVPFAFGFGGVGVAALWIFLRTLVRPAAEVEAEIHPANDGVFARGMLDDAPASRAGGAAAIDTFDTGIPPPRDPTVNEIEKLAGKRLDARQREALAKLSPQNRAMVTKVAGWLGKIKQE